MTNEYLNINTESLKAINCYWTAREISQQPKVWLEAQANIQNSRDTLDDWLNPILKDEKLRIILTGAGTSSFIGETLSPWLVDKLERRVEAISTTDIVSCPEIYLAEKDVPTLIVSFARSGDSPESLATVELANQLLSECYHLVLTCNPAGKLAQSGGVNSNFFCQLMPDGTDDISFAMTSSFTSMVVSCATIFCPNPDQLEKAVNAAKKMLNDDVDSIRAKASQNFSRLVVLGAGSLFGTAKEASLKCLELTAGNVVPLSDTPLGFRHGPKFVINDSTIIIMLESSSRYARQYEDDLFNELKRDDKACDIVRLSSDALGIQNSELESFWLSLPYIVFCQVFALFKAMSLNIPGDNPSPTGEVNRVVAGVTIYDYN